MCCWHSQRASGTRHAYDRSVVPCVRNARSHGRARLNSRLHANGFAIRWRQNIQHHGRSRSSYYTFYLASLEFPEVFDPGLPDFPSKQCPSLCHLQYRPAHAHSTMLRYGLPQSTTVMICTSSSVSLGLGGVEGDSVSTGGRGLATCSRQRCVPKAPSTQRGFPQLNRCMFDLTIDDL